MAGGAGIGERLAVAQLVAGAGWQQGCNSGCSCRPHHGRIGRGGLSSTLPSWGRCVRAGISPRSTIRVVQPGA